LPSGPSPYNLDKHRWQGNMKGTTTVNMTGEKSPDITPTAAISLRKNGKGTEAKRTKHNTLNTEVNRTKPIKHKMHGE